MSQSRKKKPETPETVAVDLAKKGGDKTVVREFVPPVTILKPPPPSGDMLLQKYYPNVSNSIPELLRAILKELLVVRYTNEHR
jgi:hypothetical protein